MKENYQIMIMNKTKFLKRLLILMLHLILLSVAVYLRHSSLEAEANPNWGYQMEDARTGIRLACEVGTIVSTLCYIILQQGDELKNQGLVAYIKQLVHEPAKLIFLASNFLLLACIPARLSRQALLEEALLIFLLPGSWFLLMFFAGAVKLTGPFVTMIFSMITGDMFTFGIIYCIVLFGFSQSFYFLYKGFPNVQSTLFSSYPSTWMALFQVTLGDYSYSDLGQTTYPNLAKAVFAIFMVFVPILLLNMLIAMMGNTYAHVIEQSEKEWVKQWAKIVVSLERSVAQEDAHRYLQEYSIGLGPSDDPRYEQRGVMVIKSKAKTRAKQRKGALSNWKRVGKVTIAELRKRGISGEELRRLMWGRASISTPTKNPIRKPPPPDCVLGGGGAGVGAGVGSALSSALDVMAFTHDMDLRGTETLQKQPTPDLLMNGTTNQLTVPSNNQGIPTTTQSQFIQNPGLNLQTSGSYPGLSNPQALGSQQANVAQLRPNLAPGLGQIPQQMGQIPPQMGQMPPQMGQIPPQMGQMPPQMGQISTQAGPITQHGLMASPQFGQIAPAITTQTGQIPPQTGQMPQYTGQIGQKPQYMGQIGPTPQYMGQVGQTPQYMGQVGQTPQYMGQVGQTPQYMGQVGQTPQYMGQVGQTPQYMGQVGQTPQYMGQVGQTPQQMGQIGPTPQYMGQVGQTPQYMGQVGQTPQQMGPIGAQQMGVMQQQGMYPLNAMPQGINMAGQIHGVGQMGPNPIITQTSIPENPLLSQSFEDFLYELVLLAESPNPRGTRIRELAAKAADLDHVPEIDINVNLTAKSAKLVVAGAVSGLFGVAADLPRDSWRHDARQNSDSEPIAESVLLGRAARTRRARSAARRAAPPPPHLYVPARSMYLVASESSAVESDAREDLHDSGRNSAMAAEDAERIRAARPHFLLDATGQAPQEHSVFIVGSGEGEEVECGAPPPHSRKYDRKHERPKTARPRRNKVSPSPPVLERGSPLEPWATAPLSRLSKIIRSTSASSAASLLSQTSAEDSPTRY